MQFFTEKGSPVTHQDASLCACCGAHLDTNLEPLNHGVCPIPYRGLSFTVVPKTTTVVKGQNMTVAGQYNYTLVPVLVEFPDGEKLLIVETHLREKDA